MLWVMPGLGVAECRRRFTAQPIVVLATHGRNGEIDLVPITFASREDVLVSAVDDKPKSTRRLQRLRNIDEDPQVTLLADHRDDDWERLWWVRARGTATVVDIAPAWSLDVLAERYAPYRERPPTGPFVLIEVSAWSGWSYV